MKLANYKKASRDVIQAIRSDGVRVGLSTIFAPWAAPFFKEREGIWFSQGRMWVFERSRITGEFMASLAGMLPKDVTLDVGAAAQQLKTALSAPDADLFAPGLDVQLFPVRGGGFVCMSKFDQLMLRAVQGMQGSFLRNKNAWRLRAALPQILESLAAVAAVTREHIYLHQQEIVLEELASLSDGDRPGVSVGGMMPEPGARRTGDSEGENAILTVIATPLKSLWVNEAALTAAEAQYGLYDYQVQGVRHLLSYSSALLADDMGLGKTRQAIVAARLVGGPGAALVVCPANLRINWQREIAQIDQDANVVIAGGELDLSQADWVIVSYERLGGIVQAINDDQLKFRVMMVDEAHYLKEPQAARTRNAFLLAPHVERRFLLTATPILNHEGELHSLLRLSGHPIGSVPVGQFLEEFAGKPELRRALSERVSEWMLRRRKDVLKTLKGKTHETQYLDLGDDERAQYRKVLSDPNEIALVKIGKLRRMLERFKADWLVNTISSLQPDDKAIIFCEFTDNVAYLKEEFAKAGIEAVTFTGEDTPIRKQKAVDAFMVNASTRVFIGTTAAAGVGQNLTSANYVFFASLPWTAAIRRQAEDRAYRNGQLRAVMVVIPVISGSIDEQIVELLKHKEGIEQDLLADEAPDPKAVEKEMAKQLLRRDELAVIAC